MLVSPKYTKACCFLFYKICLIVNKYAPESKRQGIDIELVCLKTQKRILALNAAI